MPPNKFAQDIEKAADGEPIEAIRIGSFGWAYNEPDEEAYGWDRSERTAIPPEKKNVLLSWEEARPMLDYEYDSGFGASDCHNITAWTPSRVLYVHEYDGSTQVLWLERHPVAEKVSA
jgi:hypothetical protein